MDENFFEVGGHSLLMFDLLTRLRRTDPTLTMADLFEHPTAAALARRMARAEAGEEADGERADVAGRRRALRARRRRRTAGG